MLQLFIVPLCIRQQAFRFDRWLNPDALRTLSIHKDIGDWQIKEAPISEQVGFACQHRPGSWCSDELT